jgi:hypothetical protein
MWRWYMYDLHRTAVQCSRTAVQRHHAALDMAEPLQLPYLRTRHMLRTAAAAV